MQCVHPQCTASAKWTCEACREAHYCSPEHQAAHWKSGAHRTQCITTRLDAPAAQALFDLHKLQNTRPLVPTDLTERYKLNYIASGTFGLVFDAEPQKPLGKLGERFVLKFQIDHARALEHEHAVQLYLTLLYLANDNNTLVLAPIVKVFDYGIMHWTHEEIRQFVESLTATRDAPLKAEISEKVERMITRQEPSSETMFEALRPLIPETVMSDDLLDDILVEMFGSPSRLREVLQKTYKLSDPKMLEVIRSEYARRARVNTGFIVMEHGGIDFFYIIEELAKLDKAEANKTFLDILVALLAQLTDMQQTMEFVHGDLSSANVLVTKATFPITQCYVLSSDTRVTVKTRYLPKLADFSNSRFTEPRLQRKQLEYGRDARFRNFTYAQGAELAFRPWQDVQMLCLTLVMHSVTLLKFLTPQSWAVLASMYRMDRVAVWPSSTSEVDYRQIHKFLLRRSQDIPLKPDELANLEPYVNGMKGFVLEPATAEDGPSPRKVLQENAEVFRPYTEYRIMPGEVCADMSIRVGTRSSACVEAWNALVSLETQRSPKRKMPAKGESPEPMKTD